MEPAGGTAPAQEHGQGGDRDYSKLRVLMCERGLLGRADGSARWSQEGSSVLAAVYGPRATTSWKEDAERAVVEVVYKPHSGRVGDKEREYEHLIKRTVEGVVLLALFPRTAFSIVLQAVAEDGSVLSCALNATCAALIDAGVPMKHMFVSITCAISSESHVLIDPDQPAEEAAGAVACFAFVGSSSLLQGGGTLVDEGVLTSVSEGPATVQQYLQMMELAKRGCEPVLQFLRQSLELSFKPRT